VSSPFLPLSAKLSDQKRRIAFSGICAGKNEVETEAGKLSSEFLRLTDEGWRQQDCAIQEKKRLDIL